ncbi:hypothetical protein, partial [Dickeya dadantii]|uniref:hypothetical protein n=1 Tax=Dickeya dadantii TaxID=204038 RepID=UPI001C377C1C
EESQRTCNLKYDGYILLALLSLVLSSTIRRREKGHFLPLFIFARHLAIPSNIPFVCSVSDGIPGSHPVISRTRSPQNVDDGNIRIKNVITPLSE